MTTLDRDQLLQLYYYMALNRALEERMIRLYRQGKLIGGAYMSRGQEAISVGAAFALGKDDLLVPLLRNLGSHLVRGQSVRNVFAHFLTRADSPTHGREGTIALADWSLHIPGFPAHLTAMIPLTAGFALSFKLRGERRVALNFIGNGGTNVGDFHEGLNFAAVMNLPMVLIIENNQYAYSTPNDKQFRIDKLSDRAAAYGIPGRTLDGTDVLGVYEATRDAIETARNGGGPILLEMVCMRMRGHAEHDDASYVPPALLAAWADKDPIERFVRHLSETGVWTEADRQRIDAGIEAELDEASRIAEDLPMLEGSPAELAWVYA